MSVTAGAHSASRHCCQCEDAQRKNVCVVKGEAGQAVKAYQVHVPGSKITDTSHLQGSACIALPVTTNLHQVIAPVQAAEACTVTSDTVTKSQMALCRAAACRDLSWQVRRPLQNQMEK